MAQAAERFAEKFGDFPTTGTDEVPGPAQRLISLFRQASDAEVAITLALQLRSSLKPEEQAELARAIDQLLVLSQRLDTAKLDYQTHLATQLKQSWDRLPLERRQAALSQYFSLAGDVPEWLLRHRSAQAVPPLPAAAAQLLDRFEHRARMELRSAEERFLPERQQLREVLLRTASAPNLSGEQSQAVAAVLHLLDADYGKGFRGMMLCEADRSLPAEVFTRVAEFCERFRVQLDAYRRWRDNERDKLAAELKPLRWQHRDRSEFGELMAIDMRFSELAGPLRPLWIFAKRVADAPRPEPALLTDVGQTDYRIRFVRDGQEAWLPRAQVLLAPASGGPSSDDGLSRAGGLAPVGGPGVQLDNDTKLQPGESVLCHRGGKWIAVTVIDVSPFGAVIHWEGMPDELDELEPRTSLRRNAQAAP